MHKSTWKQKGVNYSLKNTIIEGFVIFDGCSGMQHSTSDKEKRDYVLRGYMEGFYGSGMERVYNILLVRLSHITYPRWEERKLEDVLLLWEPFLNFQYICILEWELSL